jgi:hypothetical protein
MYTTDAVIPSQIITNMCFEHMYIARQDNVSKAFANQDIVNQDIAMQDNAIQDNVIQRGSLFVSRSQEESFFKNS